MSGQIPSPPAGYVLQPLANIPPPPPGYALQQSVVGSPLPTVTVQAPERLPGVLSTINDFGNDLGDSFVHHLENIPVGLAQAGAHGLKSLVNIGSSSAPEGGIGQRIASLIGGKVDSLENSIKNREDAYQREVPTNTASVVGAGLGELLPWVAGLGEARAVGAIPQATSLAGKLGTLALEGGSMGAAQPVTSGAEHELNLGDLITGDSGVPSYAKQKALQLLTGAVSGPILYGAGKLASGVSSGLGDIVQHITNPQAIADAKIASLFGADPATLARLRAAPAHVPGEVPTAAQVLATPEAVQAERLLRNNPAAGPAFVAGDNANNAARQSIIGRLAGTPDDMTAAVATRKANAAPFIQSSLTPSQPAARFGNALKPIEATLSKPIVRDANFQALNDAKNIMQKVRAGTMQEDDALEELEHIAATTKQGGPAFNALNASMDAINKNMVDPAGVLQTIATIRNGPLGVNPKVAEGLDFLSKQLTSTQNVRGKVGTDVLDAVRQQASKLLGNAKVPGSAIGTQQGVALGPVKNQIVEAIERVAPGYRDYVAGYRADSAPINTMASVSKLVDPNAPGSLNTAGDPRLAISRLRQVLRGDDKAKFPMSKDARRQLDQVRESLLRRTISDNPIAASGPATAADLNASKGSALGSLIFGDPLSNTAGVGTRLAGSAIGGTLAHALGLGPLGDIAGTAIGSILPEVVNRTNAGIASRIGTSAADSGLAADAIERYIAKLPKASPARQMLGQLLLGTPAATPAALQAVP